MVRDQSEEISVPLVTACLPRGRGDIPADVAAERGHVALTAVWQYRCYCTLFDSVGVFI